MNISNELGGENVAKNRILVLNLGSTSFKYKMFNFGVGEAALATGGIERIGAGESTYAFSARNGKQQQGVCQCSSFQAAFDLALIFLKETGALPEVRALDAVGYKAVHGGPISGAQLVDDALLAVMEKYSVFAPAHNPAYIKMMRIVQERYPTLPQVAYFETSFHVTIPEYRVVYGVPYEWQDTYGIRRYGFHGSSHSYIAMTMAELAPEAQRVISVHLGGSCSICAISRGKSVACSMGATPQSGLFHNNRVGDLDVFCLPVIAQAYDDDLTAAMSMLSSKGGFLGLSGVSNDFRDVQCAAEGGNKRAKLAIDAFVDSIVGYIGMYTAYLGGLDALVFTGGIGQHSAYLRARVCEQLAFLGVKLDEGHNAAPSPRAPIHTPESRVSVWAMKTNEELMVARRVRALLESTQS